MNPVISCARCGKQTADPDKWDPEADTGIVYCDACWPFRDQPRIGTEPLSGCGTCAMTGQLLNPVTKRNERCMACDGKGVR